MMEGEMSYTFKEPKKKTNPIMNFFKGCLSAKPKDAPQGKRPVARPSAEESKMEEI
jgi:hypothetical protein